MSDSAQVRQALTFFWPDRSYPLEIRLWQRPLISGLKGLDKRKKAEIAFSGFFDDEEALISQVEKFNAQEATIGIFAVMNTITKGSHQVTNQISKAKKTTKDKDIEKRQSLLIDIDPARASGFKKFCSTEDEKRQALKVRNQVLGLLNGQGWPDPCEVDSGNGFHLLYRIDLPKDDASKNLIRNFLKALNKILPDELRGLAEIDEKVHNAGRVTKLPGTNVRKAKAKDRPWRESRIMALPERFEVVSEAQIQAIIELGEQQATKKKEALKSKRSEHQVKRSATKKKYAQSTKKNLESIETDEKIRPCIKSLIKDALGKKDVWWGHSARLAVMAELLSAGYPDQALHDLFAHFEDYSEDATQKHVAHCRSSYIANGGTFWRCSELLAQSVVPAEVCESCNWCKSQGGQKLDYDLAGCVTLDQLEKGFGIDPKTGKICLIVQDEEGNPSKPKPVCDGFCHISEQTRREDGRAIFTLAGRGSRDGHEFTFDMPAGDFADGRKLKAALVEHFGALNKVGKLNGEIIQSVTNSVKNWKLVNAPKWIDGKLAIPGLDILDNAKFDLPRQVPVELSGGNLDGALECVEYAMDAADHGNMAILLTSVLGAPAIARMFPDDRYGLALNGGTGSFKTTLTTMLMSIYGNGYNSESNLIRWGDGATVNAIMKLAESAGCLPFLVDNYKPIKRNGPQQLIGFIHGVLEGGAKNRLNRNAELVETSAYECLPIVTGEDYPDSDSATLARTMVMDWGRPDQATESDRSKALTEAQDLADNLPALGHEWCLWLSSADGHKAMDQVKALFNEDRQAARKALRESGCVNPGRVGSNVAVLKGIWRLMLRCSFLQETVEQYTTAFEQALESIMRATIDMTQQANEGEQFVDGLKELVNSQRVVILDQLDPNYQPGQYHPGPGNKPIIGWQEEDRIYLFPKTARQQVNQAFSNDGQALSAHALNRQLSERGYIVEHDPGLTSKKKKYGKRSINTLCVSAELFVPDIRTAIETGTEYDDLSLDQLEKLPKPDQIDFILQAARIRD